MRRMKDELVGAAISGIIGLLGILAIALHWGL